MAKTIKTRIQLKYDTLNNWLTNNPVLLAGEVAIATGVDLTAKDDIINSYLLMKVGDGTTHFEFLPWVSAVAADVYAWAKLSWNEFVTEVLPVITDTIAAGAELDETVAGNVKTIKHETKLTGGFTGGATAGSATEAGKTVIIKVPKLTVNEYGHITGATDVSYTITIPEAAAVNDGALTLKAGGGLSATQKQFTANDADNVTFEVSHGAKPTTGTAHTATAGSGRTYITKIDVDSYGHIAEVYTSTETDQTIPDITITEDISPETPETDTVSVYKKLTPNGHTLTEERVLVPTKAYVDSKVSGAVEYLGTVGTATGLSTTAGKGDFYRASAQFTLGTEIVHIGDIIIATVNNPTQDLNGWDVAHLEIDTDTWTANSSIADGYVKATDGIDNAGKVWKVGTDGEPGWFTEHQAKNIVGANATAKENAAVAATTNSIFLNLIENDTVRSSHNIVGLGATQVSSDTNGKITIYSTDTNTWRPITVQGTQLSDIGLVINAGDNISITTDGPGSFIISADCENIHHTPSFTSGLKIGTGNGVGDLYVPAPSATQNGYLPSSWYSGLDNLLSVWRIDSDGTLYHSMAGIVTIEPTKIKVSAGDTSEITASGLSVTINTDTAAYGAAGITFNGSILSFPSAGGTLARTSDIPTNIIKINNNNETTYDGEFVIFDCGTASTVIGTGYAPTA